MPLFLRRRRLSRFMQSRSFVWSVLHDWPTLKPAWYEDVLKMPESITLWYMTFSMTFKAKLRS